VGEHLDALIRTRGPAETREAIEIARQILAGLEAGVGLPRHLVPGDVLVGFEGGRPRVTLLPGSGDAASAYTSPERERGEPCDARSDLWVVGVLLHELVSGEAAEAHPPLPPLRTELGVPRKLQQAIAKAVELDPRDRFPTARAFMDALDAI
jgi:serine/threonine-protein kinase